jgi:glycosyltransferase involved in cell wall biosynthesis
MIKTQPDISVLMPAYNAEKYIGKAITSLLKQTFSSYELIIINDGSTDNTENIIHSFNDKRIKLINQDNKGIAAALNAGLEAAQAKYIARFDADDICLPDRLEIQYKFLAANPDYVIVGSDADYVDMYDEYVFSYRSGCYTNDEIQQQQFLNCPFVHSSVLFKKDIVLKEGGYNVHAHTFEDHLLWPKILAHGKGCNLPKALLKVRLNPGSIAIDEKWRSKKFHKIKYDAIYNGNISEDAGNELMKILNEQNTKKIKEGAYYALLSKKYLWNNYHPEKARKNLRKTLAIHPTDIHSYGLYLLSYMPDKVIQKIYNRVRGI